MFQRLDTTLLRVSDIAESRRWYEEILGLSVLFTDSEEKLIVLDTSERTSLTLWQIKQGELLTPAVSSGCYPIFSVDNANAARQHLTDRGVKADELIHNNGVTYFRFTDPDGHTLEACQVHE